MGGYWDMALFSADSMGIARRAADAECCWEHALLIDPEYQLCRRSCQYFIFDSGRLKTKDEHDAEHPVKVFPVKPYLRVMLDCLLLTAGLIPPAKARYAR